MGVGSGEVGKKFPEMVCTLVNVRVIGNLEADQGPISLCKHLQASFPQLDMYNQAMYKMLVSHIQYFLEQEKTWHLLYGLQCI